MDFKFYHNNINVFNLNKSMKFYEESLGLKESSRIEDPDGGFIIVYLSDSSDSSHKLELTWLRDRKEPYNLGENEFHIAFTTSDYDKAFKKHSDMGCICFVNEEMGIYFISDPDNYWIEILPEKMRS